jgi:hypothetical protein
LLQDITPLCEMVHRSDDPLVLDSTSSGLV